MITRERVYNVIGMASVLVVTLIIVWLIVNYEPQPRSEPAPNISTPDKIRVDELQTESLVCAVVTVNEVLKETQCYVKVVR